LGTLEHEKLPNNVTLVGFYLKFDLLRTSLRFDSKFGWFGWNRNLVTQYYTPLSI